MNACSLGGIDPQNRTAWRSGIRSIGRLLSSSATGTTSADEIKNQDQVKSSGYYPDVCSLIPTEFIESSSVFQK